MANRLEACIEALEMAWPCTFSQTETIVTRILSAEPTEEEIEDVARTIHEAKIKSCWPKAMQAGREPWDKPNSAVPDQPWHDIARDEAKAALMTVFGGKS